MIISIPRHYMYNQYHREYHNTVIVLLLKRPFTHFCSAVDNIIETICQLTQAV